MYDGQIYLFTDGVRLRRFRFVEFSFDQNHYVIQVNCVSILRATSLLITETMKYWCLVNLLFLNTSPDSQGSDTMVAKKKKRKKNET